MKLSIQLVLLIGFWLLSCAFPADLRGQPFSELVIFGDSWTDAGNVYHDSGQFNPQSPYFEGRYSNGPVWPAHLADVLAIERPTASQLGGTNYAYGGAQTGGGNVTSSWFSLPNSGPIDIPNIGSQIERYLESSTETNSSQLFAIFGGFNDFNVSNARPEDVVNNIVNHVRALHDAGAKNFLLFTLEFEDFDPKYAEFNRLLLPAVDNLKESVPANFFLVDFKRLTGPVIDSFSDYAIVSQFDSAMNETREVVSNPGQYFWWDPGFHPTTRYHQILATKISEILVPDSDTTYVAGWRTIGEQKHSELLNVAIGGTATQSSDGTARNIASLAIDGDRRGAAITKGGEAEHWWQVSLDNLQVVTDILIYSNNEVSLVGGDGFRVELLDDSDSIVWQKDVTDTNFDYPLRIRTNEQVEATTVRLTKLQPFDERFGYLQLQEVELYGTASVAADLELHETEKLHFEIDATSGAGDFLDVTGRLVLGNSTLQVEVIEGNPIFGNSFRLFKSNAMEGEFGAIDLPGLSGGLFWDVSRLYSEGSISVVPEPSADQFYSMGAIFLMCLARRRRNITNARNSKQPFGDF